MASSGLDFSSSSLLLLARSSLLGCFARVLLHHGIIRLGLLLLLVAAIGKILLFLLSLGPIAVHLIVKVFPFLVELFHPLLPPFFLPLLG